MSRLIYKRNIYILFNNIITICIVNFPVSTIYFTKYIDNQEGPG